MRSPFGDHAGLPSLSPQLVSRRGSREPHGSSQRLVLPLFFSMEYDVTVQTAREPTGAIATLPTRSTLQRDSISIARATYAVRRLNMPSFLSFITSSHGKICAFIAT